MSHWNNKIKTFASGKESMQEFNDRDNAAGTVPPHSTEAEQSVLGALLLDNSAFDRVGDILTESDFYHPDHREIYTTISSLIVANKAADVITVHERGKHDLVYLNSLCASVPSAASARRYAEIVRERAIDRQVIKVCGDGISKAADSTIGAEEKLTQLQESLAAIAMRSSDQEPVLVDSTMPAYIDEVEKRTRGEGEVYKTGNPDLDRALNGGMRPGQLIVLAARPSMGKSTLAMSIARHVAQQQGLGVLVLSMEMPTQQINDANIAALGNIELDRVLQPDPSDDDFWSRFSEAVERVSRMSMWIDEQAALRLIDVRKKIVAAKRKAKKAGVKLVLVAVDYLQLMQGDGENRAVQIGAIANGLKALGKQHGVTMLALAQCNREADKKPEGADSMSDINESGGIEAAADCVGLIHREAVRQPDVKELANYGELRIPKNRIGKVGRVKLYFDGSRQFFGSWEGPSPAIGRGKVRATHAGGIE